MEYNYSENLYEWRERDKKTRMIFNVIYLVTLTQLRHQKSESTIFVHVRKKYIKFRYIIINSNNYDGN